MEVCAWEQQAWLEGREGEGQGEKGGRQAGRQAKVVVAFPAYISHAQVLPGGKARHVGKRRHARPQPPTSSARNTVHSHCPTTSKAKRMNGDRE